MRKFNSLLAVAFLLAGSSASVAQEVASVKPEWPSFVFYGDGLNQKTDQRGYWEGQQGQHLADWERGKQRKNASGFNQISSVTGNRRTTFVGGYTRKDGTRVRAHYRSRR